MNLILLVNLVPQLLVLIHGPLMRVHHKAVHQAWQDQLLYTPRRDITQLLFLVIMANVKQVLPTLFIFSDKLHQAFLSLLTLNVLV